MSKAPVRFGPVELAADTTKINALALMFAALTAIPFVAFVGFLQPYLFAEVFHIPKNEWGALTGNLAAMQELILILLMGVVGAMSDNLGRRPLMVGGLVLLAAGYILYPLAKGQEQIFLFRVVVALGVVCIGGMYSALIADTSANNSRGKLLGLASVATGVGMVTLAVFAGRLPKAFQDIGSSPALAGQYAFWLVAVACLLIAIVMRLTLRGGQVSKESQRQPIATLMREGFREARVNPKIALTYCCAFASRADLLVVGTYLSLWVVHAGAEQGISTADSMIRYGILFGTVQGMAMIWALVMGVVCDRVNRLFVVCFAFALAGFAYFIMGNMSDPFDSSMIFACLLLGMGEISTVITSASLVGQEAPIKTRGSVVGVFGLFGAVGLLVASYLGGQVFDMFSPSAPFTMMAVINSLICLFALMVCLKTKANKTGGNQI